MPKRYRMISRYAASLIADERGFHPNENGRQRLLAVHMAVSGNYTAVQIAKRVGISRRRFFDWMNKFKRGGVAGLLKVKHHGGGPPTKIRGNPFKKFRAGLMSGRWRTATEIQKWLKEKHSIRLKLSGVYYWLRKFGNCFKRDETVHLANNSRYWARWWKRVQ
jgi:transposase